MWVCLRIYINIDVKYTRNTRAGPGGARPAWAARSHALAALATGVAARPTGARPRPTAHARAPGGHTPPPRIQTRPQRSIQRAKSMRAQHARRNISAAHTLYTIMNQPARAGSSVHAPCAKLTRRQKHTSRHHTTGVSTTVIKRPTDHVDHQPRRLAASKRLPARYAGRSRTIISSPLPATRERSRHRGRPGKVLLHGGTAGTPLARCATRSPLHATSQPLTQARALTQAPTPPLESPVSSPRHACCMARAGHNAIVPHGAAGRSCRACMYT